MFHIILDIIIHDLTLKGHFREQPDYSEKDYINKVTVTSSDNNMANELSGAFSSAPWCHIPELKRIP